MAAYYSALTQLGNGMMELNVMHELCTRGKEAMKGELDKLHVQMDKEEEGLDDNKLDGFYRDINDHYIMISETLPLYQNYSNFTFAYALFEKCLNDTCSHLRHERSLELSLKEIQGQGVPRAKLYLTKVASLKIESRESPWPAIAAYGEIRNAIAHRAGFVDYAPENPASAFNRLSKIPDLTLEHEILDQPDRQIRFDTAFVCKALTTYRKAFDLAWQAIQETEPSK